MLNCLLTLVIIGLAPAGMRRKEIQTQQEITDGMEGIS